MTIQTKLPCRESARYPREGTEEGTPTHQFDVAEGSGQTRRAASKSIAGFAGDHRERVLAFIQSRGQHGASDEEVSEALGLKLDTSRARRCELRDAGDVIDGGGRRRTHSGRLAVCWVDADQAGTSEGPAPVDRPATPAAAPAAEAVNASAGERCPRCGGCRFVDVPIHRGRSVRRDCRRCGLFLAFVRWNGRPVKPKRPGSVMARRAAGETGGIE
ncbi:MAG TPA: hypothetical protein VMY37_05620 [Thermoguttaceae bacterium]|nr:hypothetical protein [Thermoguttaceae bacterium]